MFLCLCRELLKFHVQVAFFVCLVAVVEGEMGAMMGDARSRPFSLCFFTKLPG